MPFPLAILAFVALLAGVGACDPGTDLASAAVPAPAPAAPAGVLLDPAPGLRDAPANLDSFLIAGSWPSWPSLRAALTLETGGASVPVVLGAPLACPPGLCLEVAPVGGVRPGASYAVWVEGTLLGQVAAGGGTDLRPPRVRDVRVEPRAGCLQVQLRADEPVRVVASLAAVASDEPATELLLGAGLALFDTAFAPPPGAAGRPGLVTLRISDRAGLQAPPPSFELPLPLRPPLVITELLVNPAGAE